MERSIDRAYKDTFVGDPVNGKFNRYNVNENIRAVEFSVPGMDKKDLSIEVNTKHNMNILTVKGEVSTGIDYTQENVRVRKIHHDFYLGDDVDVSTIVAKVDKGLLTITYSMKKEEEQEGDTIKIKIK